MGIVCHTTLPTVQTAILQVRDSLHGHSSLDAQDSHTGVCLSPLYRWQPITEARNALSLTLHQCTLLIMVQHTLCLPMSLLPQHAFPPASHSFFRLPQPSWAQHIFTCHTTITQHGELRTAVTFSLNHQSASTYGASHASPCHLLSAAWYLRPEFPSTILFNCTVTAAVHTNNLMAPPANKRHLRQQNTTVKITYQSHNLVAIFHSRVLA